MKTPDEIKKGLWVCGNDTFFCSEKCPYFNPSSNGTDCSSCMHGDAVTYITQLEQRLAQAERERDAAVFDLHGHCDYCKTGKNDCAKCVYYHYFHIEEPVEDLWQWRGVCEENSP